MSAAAQNLETGNVATYRATAAIGPTLLVQYDGSNEGNVIVAAGIAAIAIGVTTTTAAISDQVEVQTGGVAKITAGGVIAIGAEVAPQAGGTGRVVAASGLGSTARVVGIAENASGANGEVIRVRLRVPNLGGPANT